MRSVLALPLLALSAEAFYLPGVAPHEYADGERVEIKVNKLSSTKTQMPYDYYSLPFCKPDTATSAIENLGEVLHGSVIQNSPYDIFMGKSSFKVLCRTELTPKSSMLLAKRIKEDYRTPAAVLRSVALSSGGHREPSRGPGWRLGRGTWPRHPGPPARLPAALACRSSRARPRLHIQAST